MASSPVFVSIVLGLLQLANCQYMVSSNGMVSMLSNGDSGPIYAQMATIVPPEVVLAEDPVLVAVANGNGGEATAETLAAVTNGNGGNAYTRFFFRSNTNANGYTAAPQPTSNGARFQGFFRTANGGYGAAVAPAAEPAPAPAPEAISNGYTVVSNGARFNTFFRTGNGNGGYGAAVAPVEPVPAPAPAPEAISNGYAVAQSNGARFNGFFRTTNGGYGAVMTPAEPAPVEPLPAPAPEAITNGYGAAQSNGAQSNGARFNGFFRTANGGYGAAVAPAEPAPVEPVPTPAPEAITNGYGAAQSNGARFSSFFRTANGGYGAVVAPAEPAPVEPLPAPAPVPEAITNGYAVAQSNGARFNGFFRTANGGYGAVVTPAEPAPVEPVPAPAPEAITNGYAAAQSNGARFNGFFRTANGGYGAVVAPAEPVPVEPVPAPVEPAPLTNGYGTTNGQSAAALTPIPAPPQFLPTELAEGVSIPQIPGVAGVDYPIFSQALVAPTLNCQDKSAPGYYADIDTKCQVFRVCQPNVDHFAFLCPNGTMFNEKTSVCEWWYNVNCAPAAPAPIVQTYAPPPPPPTPAPIVQVYTQPPPPPPTPAPIVQVYTQPPPPPTPAPIVQLYAPQPTLPPPPPPPAPITQHQYGAQPTITEVINGDSVLVEPVNGEIAVGANGNGEALRLFGNLRVNRLPTLRFRVNNLRTNGHGNGYEQPAAPAAAIEEVVPEAAPATNGAGYNGQSAAAAVTNGQVRFVLRGSGLRFNGQRQNGQGGYEQPAPAVEEVVPEVAPTTNGANGGYNGGQAAAAVTNGNGGRKVKTVFRANRLRSNGLRNGNGGAAQYAAPAPAAVQNGYGASSNGNGGAANGVNGGASNGQEATLVVSNGDGGVAINGNGVVAINGDGGVAVNGHGHTRLNMNQIRALLGSLVKPKHVFRSGGLNMNAYVTSDPAAAQNGQETEAAVPANGEQLDFGARY